ncbi:CBL-interacting serine/threonine-protein kinase 21 isoform X2 [Setaria viridis]|uniref:CBL-interacting serine/threonine-protein kinase 21 isoform X2 n=1 Tax=Setaria viridis TaxID=4556 RepID=UPI0014939C69|nr:CBL-interacting serine/threonine-protein kinase 21 isoform X2 [Setaria viridis]
MGFVESAGSVGKYRFGRAVGEGTFAKFRLAADVETGGTVAVKVIDRETVLRNNLMHQVKMEIRAMKLLNHPNIVRIHEVIATKTKICLVMEYVSGGQLSDKLSCLKRLDEREANKYFYQLIDAVDYCHRRGVYHRDLKPENLLLDTRGNLKVSDFGLSALTKVRNCMHFYDHIYSTIFFWIKWLRSNTETLTKILLIQPGQLLSTSCGSPCYIAPESYDGAAADVWSCGVILFELLAGYLPFQDRSLTSLYRRISRAQFTFPGWFTPLQKKLILRILEPSPIRRAKISDIFDDKWFQGDYNPSRTDDDNDGSSDLEEVSTDSESSHASEVREAAELNPEPGRFINAFQLIATCCDLDLSGLFQEQKTKFGSSHTLQETLEKIRVAAQDVSLSMWRLDSSMVKLQDSRLLERSIPDLTLLAEVIEVTPVHCIVEVSKSTGDLRAYREFCRSLSSLLNGEQQPGSSSDLEVNKSE